MTDRARQYYRVEWEAGYGWPECVERRRTARNFSTLEGAARQVEIIRRLPSHHRLIGTWLGRVEWEPLPIEHVDDVLAAFDEGDLDDDDDA